MQHAAQGLLLLLLLLLHFPCQDVAALLATGMEARDTPIAPRKKNTHTQIGSPETP